MIKHQYLAIRVSPSRWQVVETDGLPSRVGDGPLIQGGRIVGPRFKSARAAYDHAVQLFYAQEQALEIVQRAAHRKG